MAILDLLNIDRELVTPFSPFHIIFCIFLILLTIGLVFLLKNRDEKKYRIVVFWFWVVIVILEIIKQILYSYNPNGEPLFNFQWYAFPFQFCSNPIYLLPFVVFCKDGKLRDGVIAFLSTFSLFAGLVVTFIYPNTVFTTKMFINHQTMIHHGSQFVLGVLSIYMYKDKFNLKFLFKGLIVFAVMSGIALVLDLVVVNFIPEGQEFNMFYISPYYESHIAILENFYGKVPYIVYLLMYLLGFTLIAFIMYYLIKGFIFLFSLKKNKPES